VLSVCKKMHFLNVAILHAHFLEVRRNIVAQNTIPNYNTTAAMSETPAARPGDFVLYEGHLSRVTEATTDKTVLRTRGQLGCGFPRATAPPGLDRATLASGTRVLVSGQVGTVVSHNVDAQTVTLCMTGTVIAEEVDANFVDVPEQRLIYALVNLDGTILTVGSAADIAPQWSTIHPRDSPLQFWKATASTLILLVGGNVIAHVIKCEPKMTGDGMFAVYPWIDELSRNVLVKTTPDYLAAAQAVLTALPETWSQYNHVS